MPAARATESGPEPARAVRRFPVADRRANLNATLPFAGERYDRDASSDGRATRHGNVDVVFRFAHDSPTKQGPISSSGFLGLMETAISYRAEQDAALLLAGQRKARAADFESPLAYCEEIISVLSDLDSFLAKLP